MDKPPLQNHRAESKLTVPRLMTIFLIQQTGVDPGLLESGFIYI